MAKMAKSGWKQWKPEDARRAVDGWRTSGLPLATYARAQGLSIQRLRWWRDRLTDGRQAFSPGAVASLVPAILTGAGEPNLVRLTVRLPGGACLEIADPSVVPAAWLVELVAGLSRPS